jgi:hypothetical protein
MLKPMHKVSKSRRRRLVVLDRTTWANEFRGRLQKDQGSERAFQKLTNEGCDGLSVMELLYDYTFSPALVFAPRFRKRDAASKGLRSVAGRLDRASMQMQETLNLKMIEEQDLGDLLHERLAVKMPASYTGQMNRPRFLEFIEDLPASLQTYALCLEWLARGLQGNMGARQVQNSIYVAELATYIQAVTHNRPSWTTVALLLAAARPASWAQKDIEPALLSKNFKSFKRRNAGLYKDIQTAIADYLSIRGRVPKGETPPTLRAWKLERKAALKAHS